jgi:predicted NBD/HSP70 family sugar kinase
MDHFAGLDVSVKETSLCIVDGTGKIVREVKVASEPCTKVSFASGRLITDHVENAAVAANEVLILWCII